MTGLIRSDPVPLSTDQSGIIRVAGTRVTLDTLVHAFKEGASAEEIAERFDVVSLADVYFVIGYYLRHQSEIEAYLLEQEREADTIQKQIERSQGDRKGLRERLLARRGGAHNDASARG